MERLSDLLQISNKSSVIMSKEKRPSKCAKQTSKNLVLSQALALYNKNDKILEELQDVQPITATMHDDVILAYPTRRVSCAVVNIPSPCVNKTIGQIEDLEIKIEECFQQFEHLLRERFASTIKMEEIDGYVFPKPSEFHATFLKKDSGDLKQQTENVLAEAIHLIRSLETDRKDAEEAYKKQKSRRKLIFQKIDNLSFWRLQKLPFAVQREHETRSSEITDLQWSLEEKLHKFRMLQNQVTKVEDLIQKLKDDINYIRQHRPLLEEKLKIETDFVDKIYQERAKAIALYDSVHEKLQKIAFEYKLTCKMAKRERAKMAKEIESTEESLEHVKKELKVAQDIRQRYSLEEERIQKHIDEDEETLTTMAEEKKEEVVKVEHLVTQMKELKTAVAIQAKKIKKLEQECETVMTEYSDTRKFWAAEINKLQKELEEILEKTEDLIDENKKLVEENEEALDSIKESLTKKAEYDHVVQDLMTVKTRSDGILKKLLKDIAQVVTSYNSTKTKTDEWEHRLVEERRKFLLMEAYFKKLIGEQSGISRIVKTRMEVVVMDQEEEKKYFQEKKDEVLQVLYEIEEPFRRLVKETETARTIHNEQNEAINIMEQQKEEIKKRVVEVKTHLAKEKDTIYEAIQVSEEKRDYATKQIEVAKNTISTLTDKIKFTQIARESKQLESQALETKLVTLRDHYGYVHHKTEHKKRLYDMFSSDLNTLEVRIEQDRKVLKDLINTRKECLKKITIDYEEALCENLYLAQKYQRTLKEFLDVKTWYTDIYAKMIASETALKDKTQIYLLLERMHFALLEYFKLQSIFSKYELDITLDQAHGNMCRLNHVQRKAKKLIRQVLDFLKSLADDSWETKG
uniref:Coiled-coil domain containing 178 n=1 Tax=Monodelphis domestica TaxID=13616 RepID=A0A5F8GLX4_MONDO